MKDVIPDEERYKDVDLSENINNRIERGIKLADIIEGIIRKLLWKRLLGIIYRLNDNIIWMNENKSINIILYQF